MSPKDTVTPLSAISGNTRIRGNGKITPSQKLKENAAQKKDDYLVLKDMPDADVKMIPEAQLGSQPSDKRS